MPQTTYLPIYTAEYPILAKAQKPGGVTVLSAVSGGDVPNKPTYVAGTIQMVSLEAEEEAAKAEVHEEEVHEEEPNEDEEEVDEDDGNGGTVKRKRTVTRTRTTTSHRRR
jgi:hypothetical protein